MQQKQQHSTSSPLVIGVGVMRTGTNSQMKAFEILFGGRCYHMEVIVKERMDHFKLWYRVANEGLTKKVADEILGDYRSSADFPAAHFYRELMVIYPEAKFVLSVRDTKRWVVSVRSTILKLRGVLCTIFPPVRWLLGMSYFVPTLDLILEQRMGFRHDMTDEEMIQSFDRHVESVKQTIPKDRLLVFQVSDGWEPLCKFLNLPVPNEPFPNVNDMAHFQRRTKIIRVASVVLNVGFCAAVGSAVWFGAKHCLRRFC